MPKTRHAHELLRDENKRLEKEGKPYYFDDAGYPRCRKCSRYFYSKNSTMALEGINVCACGEGGLEDSHRIKHHATIGPSVDFWAQKKPLNPRVTNYRKEGRT